MPEIPDLEVIRRFLNERLLGKEITRAAELRPAMVRSLAGEDFAADVIGRRFGTLTRRGKMLTLPLEPGRLLVVHPMLTGAFQYCDPTAKVAKRAFFYLGGEGFDLRYIDEKQMGLVYYVRPEQLSLVPRYDDQGPDALDAGLTYEQLVARLKPYQGEIKGILTRGEFIAGIGNAYVDEILWEARVSPFKRRKALTEDDLRSIHAAIPKVLNEAIDVLRERMVPDIHVKVRDFLKVHRKGGEPCPRCGHPISELTPNQRITSYCRHCQPGSLLKN
ncbi:MAG: Fpg/Nei family DNA glycosylase [SAR202 cluster bacterium]|nr:Fpg/Nei family DNA glycosylase [SAR202 cluster bacterium]